MAVLKSLLKIPLARAMTTGAFTVILGGGTYFGYRALRNDIAADVYRERLEALAQEYETLRTTYNAAVRKTAVTELLVDAGTLSVVIKDAKGQVTTIPTHLDPTSEIYVDYVVINGRLLIRRVFDSFTPPMSAVVLDDKLADVDWDDPDASHGKAVYRHLEEGRWVVNVSGNGSLGLLRTGDVDATEPTDLTPAPPVRDYEQMLSEVEAEIEDISVGEVWGRVVGGK